MQNVSQPLGQQFPRTACEFIVVCKADHVSSAIQLKKKKKEYRFNRKKQKLWEHETVFSFCSAVVRHLGIDRAFWHHASGDTWINKDESYRDVQRPRQRDVQGKTEQLQEKKTEEEYKSPNL